jgi:uncharacterized protein
VYVEHVIARTYPQIEKTLRAGHSVLVLGPRGSGKTVHLSSLLAQFAPNLSINLLNSEPYRRYSLQPQRLFDEVSAALPKGKARLHVMIDEIQLVPRLLSEVHRCIDAMKGRVVFLLTGSSARKLKKENADMLASRAVTVPFFPLSGLEVDLTRSLSEALRFGTLPEILSANDEWLRGEKLNTYVQSYLNEEIKQEANLRNLTGFHRFLEFAAAHNGEPVNYAKIGKASGLSAPTVREYYGVLVDTLVATEIPAWTFSVAKQLQQASKYYLFDNGVVNALLGEVGSDVRPSTYRFGRLFENLVVNEFVRQRSMRSIKANLFHYRDMRGKEVDLIAQRNPTSIKIAIEIKSAESPGLQDVPTVAAFVESEENAQGFVLCRTPQPYVLGGIRFEPFATGVGAILDSL